MMKNSSIADSLQVKNKNNNSNDEEIVKFLLEKFNSKRKSKLSDPKYSKKSEYSRIRQMESNYKTRDMQTHLYNPKKEGLGAYDIHYINAYKKEKIIKDKQKINSSERYAA